MSSGAAFAQGFGHADLLYSPKRAPAAIDDLPAAPKPDFTAKATPPGATKLEPKPQVNVPGAGSPFSGKYRVESTPHKLRGTR